MKKSIQILLITACILSLTIEPALALRMYSASNTLPQTFSDGNPHLINLGTAVVGVNVGSTWTVTISKTTRVAIFFSAECSVKAGDNSTWIDLDILVDGVAMKPTDGDNAFATSNGTNSQDSWVTAATQGVVELEPGNHNFQVRGTLKSFSSGEAWRIDDTSLTLIVQKK